MRRQPLRRRPANFHLGRLLPLVPVIALAAGALALRDRSRVFARRAELHRRLMETELTRQPGAGVSPTGGPDLDIGSIRVETRITAPAPPGPAAPRVDPAARNAPWGSPAAAAAHHETMARRYDYAAAHPWVAAPE